MTALVAYGSSDEEDGIQPEKPAKIAKTSHNEAAIAVEQVNDAKPQSPVAKPEDTVSQLPEPIQTTELRTAPDPNAPPQGPSAGPTIAVPATDDAIGADFDPYSYERQRLRELTMPTVPNFDIPSSPPPPPQDSEEAATLAATSKKLERFLELKKQGVHFNDRLQNTPSLQNPSLLPNLMDFAGITNEESYASSLSEELAVPVRWPEGCYVENLMKQNERRLKKRLQERDKVDFVPAKSGGSSASGTPSGGTGMKRSKFDRK